MLSAIIGPDPRDRQSRPSEGIDWLGCARAGDLRGKRVAYSADWGYAAVDPEVAQIARDAARVFERDLGCVVEEANPGWSDPAIVFAATMIAETDLRGMRKMIAEHGAQMSSHMVDLIMRPWSAEELTDANIGRKALANHMARFMAKYDLLLTPTTCVPPFPILMQGPDKIAGRYVRPESFLAFTIIANLTGQPAATVPAGFTKGWIAGRLADHRTASRRRDGAASVCRVRGGTTVGASMATAPGAAVSLIANGAALLLDLLEPSRKRSAHPRYALRIGSREIVAFHRIVFDIE